MSAHLLILYPIPKDVKAFDRAYREEHLPYADLKLVGATGVTTKRVVGPAFAPPPYHLMSDVSFPTLDTLKACAIRKRPGSIGARRLDQLRRCPDGHRRRGRNIERRCCGRRVAQRHPSVATTETVAAEFSNKETGS